MYRQRAEIGFSVLETGWLIQKTDAQVRGMLRRGELWYVVDRRKIDPKSVEEWLPNGLARLMMRRLLSGTLVAPRPETRWGKPARLFEGLDALMLASPALVLDTSSGQIGIVPRLGEPTDPVTVERAESSLKPILSFIS